VDSTFEQYDFTVEYRPGKYSLVADAVSRSPVSGGSDDLDEPVEPLFLAIALPNRHLLTRTSGLTSCQACLTVLLAPACLRQHLEGRRHTRRIAAAGYCVKPNEIIPNQLPNVLHTYLASLQPLLRRLPPEGPIPLSLQDSDMMTSSAEVRIFRARDQPRPARTEPVYKINNTPLFPQMVLTRSRSLRSNPATEEVSVSGAAAEPRANTRVRRPCNRFAMEDADLALSSVPQEQPRLIKNHQLPQLSHIRLLKPRNVSPSPLQSLLVPSHFLKPILPQP
jgi:hypothetical protein